MIKMESKQKQEQEIEEPIKEFEIVGQNNFGSSIKRIDWKGIIKRATITLFVGFILFMILR